MISGQYALTVVWWERYAAGRAGPGAPAPRPGVTPPAAGLDHRASSVFDPWLAVVLYLFRQTVRRSRREYAPADVFTQVAGCLVGTAGHHSATRDAADVLVTSKLPVCRGPEAAVGARQRDDDSLAWSTGLTIGVSLWWMTYALRRISQSL
jgi:hypothetical protein